MIRQNYTAVIERNRIFSGKFTSEPYECGWASEAIFFIRILETKGDIKGTQIRVQISPDGIHWCDEGEGCTLTGAELNFIRVRRFGNWLRIVGELPNEATIRLIISLTLKE